MKKVITLIISVIPMILMMLTFIFMFVFACVTSNPMTTFDMIMANIMILFAFFMGVFIWGDMIFFMVLACKNPSLHAAYKAMWCALFYCLNIWAFHVYWFLYIRTENRLVKDASE